jgi:hypothetical protein
MNAHLDGRKRSICFSLWAVGIRQVFVFLKRSIDTTLSSDTVFVALPEGSLTVTASGLLSQMSPRSNRTFAKGENTETISSQ